VAYTRTGTAAETGDIIVARGSAVGANKLTSTSATLSTTPLLTIEHTSQGNHNGGWLGFSPKNNNNLYIAVGDGGGSNDSAGNAQNTNVLLGKMLRIGVNGTDAYTIPTGNPFASGGGAPEVWAYGLRNPWRNGFDRTTGALYIGDVGQSAREEVDYQPDGELAAGQGGKNYGWRAYEGSIETPGLEGDPNPGNAVFPINEYDRTIGRAITGGYAYRGTLLGPSFQGTYFFGDSEVGKFFTLNYDGVNPPTRIDRTDEIDPLVGGSRLFGSDSLVSFGEDSAGELYAVDIGGQVYRIIPEPASLSLLMLPALLLRRRRG
jgi:glucose/arabinose dehydrogenase